MTGISRYLKININWSLYIVMVLLLAIVHLTWAYEKDAINPMGIDTHTKDVSSDVKWFGGANIGYVFNSINQWDPVLDSSLYQLGGRVGLYLPNINWMLGGKWVGHAMLTNTTWHGGMHYGGLFVEYHIPMNGFYLGIEAMAGAGGYMFEDHEPGAMFYQSDDDHSTGKTGAFFSGESRVHVYIPVSSSIAFNVNAGFVLANVGNFNLGGSTLGVGLDFGNIWQ